MGGDDRRQLLEEAGCEGAEEAQPEASLSPLPMGQASPVYMLAYFAHDTHSLKATSFTKLPSLPFLPQRRYGHGILGVTVTSL